MPKVSVLMTNYNAGKFIWEAIESILRQTFRDFELIILDDGSTDNSWNIIQKYAKEDDRIRCHKNGKNIWISATRNKLIDFSQWEFIAWLDSDDRAKKKRLERQVFFLEENPACWIVGSWINIIDAQWKSIWVKKLPLTNEKIMKEFFFRSPLNHPSSMMRRECIKATGYYRKDLEPADDLDFLARISQRYMLANIPDILLEYRIHGENLSLIKQKQMIQKTLLIRKNMQKMGYKMWIMGKCAYYITWVMQYLPSKFVLTIFNNSINFFSWKK